MVLLDVYGEGTFSVRQPLQSGIARFDAFGLFAIVLPRLPSVFAAGTLISGSSSRSAPKTPASTLGAVSPIRSPVAAVGRTFWFFAPYHLAQEEL